MGNVDEDEDMPKKAIELRDGVFQQIKTAPSDALIDCEELAT